MWNKGKLCELFFFLHFYETLTHVRLHPINTIKPRKKVNNFFIYRKRIHTYSLLMFKSLRSVVFFVFFILLNQNVLVTPHFKVQFSL